MHHLDLTEDEMNILLDVLRTARETLDYEISRADNPDFKRMLKGRRDVVARLAERASVPGRMAA